jgi:hypothetical protein
MTWAGRLYFITLFLARWHRRRDRHACAGYIILGKPLALYIIINTSIMHEISILQSMRLCLAASDYEPETMPQMQVSILAKSANPS